MEKPQSKAQQLRTWLTPENRKLWKQTYAEFKALGLRVNPIGTHISLYPQDEQLSMILYAPKDKPDNPPLHIRQNSPTFRKDVFDALSPRFVYAPSPRAHDKFSFYLVSDWHGFREVIIKANAGLPIASSSQPMPGSGDQQDPPNQDDDSLEERAVRFARVKVRPHQRKFRDAVFKDYDGQCAVSRCKIPEAVEAAHIAGKSWEKHNRASDGILLRRDLHALYDAGLLIISRDGVVSLDPKVLDYYKGFEGATCSQPRSSSMSQNGSSEA